MLHIVFRMDNGSEVDVIIRQPLGSAHSEIMYCMNNGKAFDVVDVVTGVSLAVAGSKITSFSITSTKG